MRIHDSTCTNPLPGRAPLHGNFSGTTSSPGHDFGPCLEGGQNLFICSYSATNATPPASPSCRIIRTWSRAQALVTWINEARYLSALRSRGALDQQQPSERKAGDHFALLWLEIIALVLQQLKSAFTQQALQCHALEPRCLDFPRHLHCYGCARSSCTRFDRQLIDRPRSRTALPRFPTPQDPRRLARCKASSRI